MNTQRYVGVVEQRNGQWVAVFALRSAPEMFELRTSPNWSKGNALACLDLLASEWTVDESFADELRG